MISGAIMMMSLQPRQRLLNLQPQHLTKMIGAWFQVQFKNCALKVIYETMTTHYRSFMSKRCWDRSSRMRSFWHRAWLVRVGKLLLGWVRYRRDTVVFQETWYASVDLVFRMHFSMEMQTKTIVSVGRSTPPKDIQRSSTICWAPCHLPSMRLSMSNFTALGQTIIIRHL